MSNESVFAGVIATWQKFGIFDFIVPFMLVFAIVYGVLERTNIFGERGPSVNAIIALSIAIASVLTGWFISFLTGFLPWVSVIAIVVVAALMLLAMLVGDFNKLIENDRLLKIGGVVVVGVLAIIFIIQLVITSGIEISFEQIMGAIGLTVVDFWAIMFFVIFIAAIILLGRQKSGSSSGGKT